jgi:Glycosyltransferases involved in cell wall biogenesis
MSDDFTVIIPTYNEKENIETLINELVKKSYIKRIVVVDDNSKDGTREIVQKLQNKNNKIILVERITKLGLGSAYIEGFKYANTKYVATMDADLSHHPYFLDRMKEHIKEYHIIIGSRHIKGSKIIGWNFYRYLVHTIANFIPRTFFLLNIKDVTSGYRIYEKKAFSLIANLIKSKGFSFQVESLLIAKKYGLKVKEVPIVFINRSKGSSKFNFREAFEYLMTLLKFLRTK